MSDHRAHRAGEILAEPVFQEAIEGARKRLKDAWVSATAPQRREALWHEYQAIDAVSRELRAIRDQGKATRKENNP